LSCPKLFFTSEFLVTALNEKLVTPGCRVLDLGTGSGVAAVFASQWATEVVALDVNPAAVRCARINAILNGKEDRIEVRESDLFSAVRGELFDVILFNPPYLEGAPESSMERAFFSGDVILRFVNEVSGFLNLHGYVLLVLSSLASEADILREFEERGFRHRVVARRRLLSETLRLFQIDRREDYNRRGSDDGSD
jgi:release factor glutamine methyltransferase